MLDSGPFGRCVRQDYDPGRSGNSSRNGFAAGRPGRATAARGPAPSTWAAASARAVCKLTGASSGSVYHRFPRRDDLVAATWLRAQDRFLRAYADALDPAGGRPGVDAAITVLTWCRTNPEDAVLLLRHALRDLLRGDVSPALAERAAANQRALGAALAAVAEATGHRLRDVVLAAVELPYTVARRALANGGTPTDEDVDAVRRAPTLLLGQPEQDR